MAGKKRDSDGFWAVLEIIFILTDPRLNGCKSGAKWLYICLWCVAVKERRETLQAHYYPKNDSKCGHDCSHLASISHEDKRNISNYVAELQQNCLIGVADDGSITVYGVRDKHPNLPFKDDNILDHNESQKGGNREEKSNNNNKIKNNIYSDIPFQEILNDLNKKANRNYRLIDKTKTLITARWREGFRLADFEYVHTVKVADWLDKPDMVKYLRPETLYSNKFEGYRNQPMPTKANPESWEHKMVENFIKGGQ